jgi:TonB family protein
MSPRSLVFSSDQETARALAQVLRELELEVEHCVEIFAAVERLTSYSHEVIVADWDDGLESSFLLKTSRELTANSDACTVAVVRDSESAATARQLGVDVVLTKPIIPDAAKYSLLTSDNFLQHMRVWLPQVLASQKHHTTSPPSGASTNLQNQDVSGYSRTDPSSSVETLFQNVLEEAHRYHYRSHHRRQSLLVITALSMTFLSVGYVFSQPVRAAGVTTSVARMYEKALETTQKWLSPNAMYSLSAEIAQNTAPTATRDPLASKVHVFEVHDPARSSPSPQVVASPTISSEPEQSASTPVLAHEQIPDSLKQPWGDEIYRGTSLKTPVNLSGPLQPVVVPEEIARQLLVDKVPPSYPEQARKAGLQGPVVLQAWIGKDGTIEDLKLVRGYMVLGQAAYNAVRRWKFKPYFLNGQAVEAQTFLTINFRLP